MDFSLYLCVFFGFVFFSIRVSVNCELTEDEIDKAMEVIKSSFQTVLEKLVSRLVFKTRVLVEATLEMCICWFQAGLKNIFLL